MTQNYRQVKAQIRKLQTQAERLRREELRSVLEDMRRKIREYEIVPEQLFGPQLSDLVQYRDPSTGQTWNGIGRPPNWNKGKDRELFHVNKAFAQVGDTKYLIK